MRIGEARNSTQLVEAVEEARNRRLELRRGWETLWWNNIALVGGDHYAQWNPSLSTFEDRDPTFAQTDNKKPRLVINHALTVARTELAKLTKSHPIMDVVAKSDSDEDIAAAKVGQSVLDALEWKFRLRKLRKNALWWMIQTGLGAVFVGFDFLNDQSGHFRFLIDPLTGEATFNQDREAELHRMVDSGELDELTYDEYPLGDIEYKVYSPFELFPDESVLDFEQSKDIITTEAADIDVVKGIYGRPADSLKPEDLNVGTIEKRLLQRLGLGAARDTKFENGVQVHTFWLLPGTYRGNKYLENGIMLRWAAGRTILDVSEASKSQGQFPFVDGRMPFAFFQHVPTSTSIWPDSVITHIRGPNLEIDKTVSQLIENKDFMANPMWRIAKQHKIQGKVKNVAGAIVRYTHVPNVPPPEPIQGLQMPPQVENLLVGLREQILDISGQSEVARGRVPTGVRSGVAVAYLQEEDDTKLAPTVENMEEAIAYMASLSLSRISQYYHTERILRWYRQDRVFDVVKFRGADLRDTTDVVPQAGSAMPKSKAARQQYTLELVSLGILQDPQKIESMLELGQGEPDDNDKARAQAERENQVMMHGLPQTMFALGKGHVADKDIARVASAVPVKAWHNHQIHIERHTSMMMDPEFDSLQISHPEIVRLFDEHLAMHQQELAKQQQQQLQALQAAKGAPGGAPAGDQAAGNGGGFNFNKQMTDVPDVIGRGVTRNTAMRSNPQPGGGG